jgi:serine/threonine protein kinase
LIFLIFDFALFFCSLNALGAVYKAVELRDNSQVAIKIIPFNGKDSHKLRKEIRTLKQCNCPFIVGYKGAYHRGDNVWIIMEYCAAGSISDMMQCNKRTLHEQQIAYVMKHALTGLAYLHAAGKIHRDIKGGNILVDGNCICKLADFGVSGNLDKTLGKHRTVIGTPHWMAPEVLMSDDYNEVADIWSLGITAYEFAIGEPPHAKLHSMRAALKIPMSPPPTLPDPNYWSADFHSFLAACLVKDFRSRPSAQQLLSHPFIVNAPSSAILSDMTKVSVQMIEEKSLALEQAQLAAGTNMLPALGPAVRTPNPGLDENEPDSDSDKEEDEVKSGEGRIAMVSRSAH